MQSPDSAGRSLGAWATQVPRATLETFLVDIVLQEEGHSTQVALYFCDFAGQNLRQVFF